MRTVSGAVAAGVLIFGVAACWAGDTPSTLPVDWIATTRPYHAAEIPAGFHLLTVGQHTAICQLSDDAWVRQAMSSVKPATRPSTMPSDLSASIKQRRSQWVGQIVADMAIKDPKQLNDTIDQQILPSLAKLETLKPPAFFLVISRPKLAALMDKGWSDPRYHYVRYAHDVAYNHDVVLSVDRHSDDLVMWAEIQDDSSEAAKRDALVSAITDFDGSYAESISEMAQQGVGSVLDEFIRKNVMNPLNLPQQLQWFGQGVAAVYSVKYASMISGESRGLMTAILVQGDPRNPLESQPLDLVQPLDASIMEPQFVIVYHEALYHKAASAIAAWIAKGGDGVFAKTLPLLRDKPPTSSADLINIVQQATGIDLTPVMLPNYKETIPQL